MKLSDQTDPQKLGSEITYYRRYTLQSLLALQAEDDDGNKASRPAPKKAETKLAIPTKEQIGAMRKALGQYTIEDFKKKYALTPETIKQIENGTV